MKVRDLLRLEKIAEGDFGVSTGVDTAAGAAKAYGGYSIDAIKTLLGLGLAAPVVAGAGAGYLSSKATDPVGNDEAVIEQGMLNSKVDRMNAELEREIELAKMKSQRDARKGKRRAMHLG